MSSKPRHGDIIGNTEHGDSVTLSYQAQKFFDELDIALSKITELEKKIKALEDAN